MFVRKYPHFLIIIVLLFFLFGCSTGGGTPETTDTTQAGQTSGTQAPIPTTTTAKVIKLPRPFKPIEEMPDSIKKALDDKRPFLVIIYLKDDYTWDEIKPEIDNVEGTYDQIAFFYIDIDSTKKDEKKSNLVRELESNYLPELFLIDQKSQIVFQHSGYINRDTLKNEIHKSLSKK